MSSFGTERNLGAWGSLGTFGPWEQAVCSYYIWVDTGIPPHRGALTTAQTLHLSRKMHAQELRASSSNSITYVKELLYMCLETIFLPFLTSVTLTICCTPFIEHVLYARHNIRTQGHRTRQAWSLLIEFHAKGSKDKMKKVNTINNTR